MSNDFWNFKLSATMRVWGMELFVITIGDTVLLIVWPFVASNFNGRKCYISVECQKKVKEYIFYSSHSEIPKILSLDLFERYVENHCWWKETKIKAKTLDKPVENMIEN